MIDNFWKVSDAEDSFDSVEHSSTLKKDNERLQTNLNGNKNEILRENLNEVLKPEGNNKNTKMTEEINKNKIVRDKYDKLDELENRTNPGQFVTLTLDDALKLVKKVFLAAAEREISVGDGVDVWLVKRVRKVGNGKKNGNENGNKVKMVMSEGGEEGMRNEERDEGDRSDNKSGDGNDYGSKNNENYNNNVDDNEIGTVTTDSIFTKNKRKSRNFGENFFRVEKFHFSLPQH